MLGKIDAPLNAKLNSIKWGEFRLGDLFRIENTLSFNSDKLTHGKEYDYITRTSLNQGILHTTGFVNQENINKSGTWSLGLLQMDFFYRSKPWYAGQFVRKIIPRIAIPRDCLLFFQTLLNRQKPTLLQVLVRNVDSTFENISVKLPVSSNGDIDFDFISSFMQHLENDKILKLSSFLKESGLYNYKLTEKEREALNSKLSSIRLGEFILGDLFEIVGTRSLDSNAIEFVDTGINFIGRTFENNGIQGYITKRSFEPNASFTITATVIGNYKYVKFQKEPYYCSQNINKLTPKKIISRWNAYIAYYFVTIVQKFVSTYDGQQGGYKLNDIKNFKFNLPITKSGEIDCDFIETIIMVIQKLLIRDVVKYVDEKLDHQCEQ